MRAIAMKREFIDRRIEDEQDRLTAVAQERANSSTSSNAARDVGVLIETIKQNEEARVESVAAEEVALQLPMESSLKSADTVAGHEGLLL
eukprot:1830690-Amphidinium_carterae.1